MTPHATLVALLILTTTTVTLSYAAACWIWPFTACRRCGGLGKRRSPSGRAYRYCRRCKGTGGRLRTGRWIYNFLSNTRRAAR